MNEMMIDLSITTGIILAIVLITLVFTHMLVHKESFLNIVSRIGSAVAIIVSLWHLIQLGISVEKLHVKLQDIEYCISRPIEVQIDEERTNK